MSELCDCVMALKEAIQHYINEHSDRPTMLDQAVVIWEEVGFDDDGEPFRMVNWTIPTDNFSLAMAVGLCDLGRAYIQRDIVRVKVLEED